MESKMIKDVCSLVFVFAFMFVGVASTQAAEKKQEKVKICHVDKESGIGKVLLVSENATKAHLGHGDPATFIANKNGSCQEYIYKGKK